MTRLLSNAMRPNVCAWAVVGVRCASLSPLQKRILKDNTFTLNQNPPLRMHFVVCWRFFNALFCSGLA
jgi:hypothetical protein